MNTEKCNCRNIEAVPLGAIISCETIAEQKDQESTHYSDPKKSVISCCGRIGYALNEGNSGIFVIPTAFGYFVSSIAAQDNAPGDKDSVDLSLEIKLEFVLRADNIEGIFDPVNVQQIWEGTASIKGDRNVPSTLSAKAAPAPGFTPNSFLKTYNPKGLEICATLCLYQLPSVENFSICLAWCLAGAVLEYALESA